MEFPYIDKTEIGYSLNFEIPAELIDAKIPDLVQPRFSEIAESVFARFHLSTAGYPRLSWRDGSLESIALGLDCSCVTRSDSKYHFHNVDSDKEAMAALQILSRYVTALSMFSSQPTSSLPTKI